MVNIGRKRINIIMQASGYFTRSSLSFGFIPQETRSFIVT